MFGWKGGKAIQTVSPSFTQNKHKYQIGCSGKGNTKEFVHLLDVLNTHSLDFVIKLMIHHLSVIPWMVDCQKRA